MVDPVADIGSICTLLHEILFDLSDALPSYGYIGLCPGE